MQKMEIGRVRWALALLLILAGATSVGADQGCFDCVIDYDDCQFPAGVCSNMCEQVGHNETGEGIYCGQVEVFFGPGGKECYVRGGACLNTDVVKDDGEIDTCPDGEVCD